MYYVFHAGIFGSVNSNMANVGGILTLQNFTLVVPDGYLSFFLTVTQVTFNVSGLTLPKVAFCRIDPSTGVVDIILKENNWTQSDATPVGSEGDVWFDTSRDVILEYVAGVWIQRFMLPICVVDSSTITPLIGYELFGTRTLVSKPRNTVTPVFMPTTTNPTIPNFDNQENVNDIGVAGEQLLAYRLIKAGAYGKLYNASAGNINDQNVVIGMTLQAGSVNRQVTYQTMGVIVNGGWNWTPQQRIYLGVNGELTTNNDVGIIYQQIGVAITNNSMVLDIKSAIKRSF